MYITLIATQEENYLLECMEESMLQVQIKLIVIYCLNWIKNQTFSGKGAGRSLTPPPVPQLCNAIQYTILRPVLFIQYTQFPDRATEWQSSRWMTPKQMGRMNRMLQGMNELRFRKDEGSKCKKENNEMIYRPDQERNLYTTQKNFLLNVS